MWRQFVYGHRLQHDEAGRDFERFLGAATLLKITIKVRPSERDDDRGVRALGVKTFDRRVAAAVVQRNKQVVITAFVSLRDGDAVTEVFENAGSAQRSHAVAISGPGWGRGNDSNSHCSFESAQAPNPAHTSRRSGL